MSKFGDIEFERRVFPRFILHLPFSYQLVGDNSGKELEQETTDNIHYEDDQSNKEASTGITANASQGGLMVYLPEKVNMGDKLKVRISLTEQSQVKNIETMVEVIWVNKTTLSAPRLYKVGIKFVDITEESLSFLKWFEQLWLEQSS